MKLIRQYLLILSCFGPATFYAAFLVSGCSTPKFETGGAYAATAVAPAMPELYIADSAFDLAYQAIDLSFKYEKQNRATLWQISPKIKQKMDGFRGEASQVWLDYAVARQAYLSVPTQPNLNELTAITSKLAGINAAVLAVIANKGK